MTRADAAAALSLVLAITGLAASLVLLSSFLLEPGDLALLPQCPAKRAGGACVLCGMSHSFMAVSSGRLEEALTWNPFGPWLYSTFVLLSLTGAQAAKYATSEYLRKSAHECTLP